jgi:hypothetical protein
MKVVYCGQLDYWKDAPDHLGIKQGMTDLGWDWHVVDPCMRLDQLAAMEINDLAPDLVIHGNTDSFGQNIPEQIRPDAVQIFWMLDYRTPDMLQPGEWADWTRSAPFFKAVFISAKGHMQMWQQAFQVPVFFAPHACWIPPPLVYDEAFDHDLLFIGGHHDQGPLVQRAELILEIQFQLIKHDIKIKQVNEGDWEKRNQIWKDMPKYYNSSKVVLDVSHFWDNPGYCSGRYWYTAALGACAVTKFFPECTDFFPTGAKWYFDEPKDAVDLIVGLLENADTRMKTKLLVTEIAWTQHTYKRRFQQMMNSLQSIGVLDDIWFESQSRLRSQADPV